MSSSNFDYIWKTIEPNCDIVCEEWQQKVADFRSIVLDMYMTRLGKGSIVSLFHFHCEQTRLCPVTTATAEAIPPVSRSTADFLLSVIGKLRLRPKKKCLLFCFYFLHYHQVCLCFLLLIFFMFFDFSFYFTC